MKKDKGYVGATEARWLFKDAFTGSFRNDPDSAQVAIGWMDAKDRVIDTSTNAQPDNLGISEKPSADWVYTKQGENEEVSKLFPIEPKADKFKVVLVFTDILDGNDQSTAYTQGDLPYIIGSWTVTWKPDLKEWKIDKNDADVSYIKKDLDKTEDFQNRYPTKEEIETWTEKAKGIVATTGCKLRERQLWYGPIGFKTRCEQNSGYDVYK